MAIDMSQFDPRGSEIKQAVEQRMVRDVKIQQKVNQAHREAFREKFPGQVEHCMRLTAERLQACLNKTDTTVLQDPKTWPATTREISDLAVALNQLMDVHSQLRSQ